MSYIVKISAAVAKRLAHLTPKENLKIVKHLRILASDPFGISGVKKLRGSDGWRLRIGNWRALYTVDDNTREVNVYHFGSRGDVYK